MSDEHDPPAPVETPSRWALIDWKTLLYGTGVGFIFGAIVFQASAWWRGPCFIPPIPSTIPAFKDMPKEVWESVVTAIKEADGFK